MGIGKFNGNIGKRDNRWTKCTDILFLLFNSCRLLLSFVNHAASRLDLLIQPLTIVLVLYRDR